MTDHEYGIEAAIDAFLSGRHASVAAPLRPQLEAAISAYLATTEPGKPESGVLAEAVKPVGQQWRYRSKHSDGTWFEWSEWKEGKNQPISLETYQSENRFVYASPAPSLGVDIETLQRRVKELEAALKPFVDEIENWTDSDGWAPYAPANDRIRDWFGPSDFRRAREVLVPWLSEETAA